MMRNQTAKAILGEIVKALDLDRCGEDLVELHSTEGLPSCFPVTELASASIAAAGLTIADLIGTVADTPNVAVDNRLASLWFGFSIQPQGWTVPAAWDVLAGDYQTTDGWIKLHTNAPHHRVAAIRALGCPESREAVTKAIHSWDVNSLQDAIVVHGGCAAALNSWPEWLDHPQGRAVADEPPVIWDRFRSSLSSTWAPLRERPLAGLRVLDLTRVLAGPVATHFLGGYGAQILRIDPPGWDEPGVIPEVTVGKRCARLDLRRRADRLDFTRLLSQADILIHGYRADALDGLGFGADARQEIRPGLIDISLNAYGHSGPWINRRGFDSLVQFSSGIAAKSKEWRNSDVPVSLPVQALDQATVI